MIDFLTEVMEIPVRKPVVQGSLTCESPWFKCKVCSDGFMTLGEKGYIVCGECGYEY